MLGSPVVRPQSILPVRFSGITRAPLNPGHKVSVPIAHTRDHGRQAVDGCPHSHALTSVPAEVFSVSEIPSHFSANCGVCGTRVTPSSKYAGRRVKCPDCETPIPIPSIEDYLERKRRDELMAPTQPDEVGAYSVEAPIERPQVKMTYTSQKAIVHRVNQVKKKLKPPKWVFFSDVFNLPWQTKQTALRWSWMCGGLTFAGLLGALCQFAIEQAGMLGMIAGLFFVMGQAWFAAWAMAYAASCSFSIIQDTASGLKVVEGWPDGGFRDWMMDFLVALYVLAISGFIAYLVSQPVGLALSPVFPSITAMHLHLFVIHGLLFPIAFLGALDADSIWLPFSGTILRSLIRIPHWWLLFYVLLGALWGAATAVVFPALVYSVAIGSVLGGPVLGSVLFISARLIGRLAWKISDDATRVDDDDDDDE